MNLEPVTVRKSRKTNIAYICIYMESKKKKRCYLQEGLEIQMWRMGCGHSGEGAGVGEWEVASAYRHYQVSDRQLVRKYFM